MQIYRKIVNLALMVSPLLVAGLASGSTVGGGGGGCDHVTDGTFTTPGEWSCSTVSKSIFPQAVLYADQGVGVDNNLYLMYDYTGGTTPSSFFDVFFEVVPNDTDYLVRISSSAVLNPPDPSQPDLSIYEKPIGITAPIDGNGNFIVGPGSPWETLLPGDPDIASGQFKGAVGFGTSPNSATPHPMAEFQLTIDRSGTGGPSGLYSPDPAFWGASETSGASGPSGPTGGCSAGCVDPPISSGIFQLNPDGTTTVTPVLDSFGQPEQQGSAVPEPGTLLPFASGVFGLLGVRRLRQRR
ncbi:exported hypothetical protein [Candidatus Sulfopaludibacter sp. SbA3]|nr:exported hypothetical protein [Candidatus Sulfopaludibacter sp. SbA3]